jgi:2-methylisocitrate lyase-like PEP mutase family enzyme
MADQPARIATFRALHAGPDVFVMPNPWDAGAAKLLASLGFPALATTSSGMAMTLGRRDGDVTRAEVLDHLALMAAATDVPLSADTENGFADAPDGVADTVRLVADTGVAGCSIEDSTGRPADPLYDAGLARARVEAAVEAAAASGIVITARAEGFLRGSPDLAEVIARLQSFQEAGADCLFAPGLRSLDDIRTLVTSVDRPVNVLIWPGGPSVAELGALGVRRISVGGALAWTALGHVADAARHLLDHGTVTYGDASAAGRAAFLDALA